MYEYVLQMFKFKTFLLVITSTILLFFGQMYVFMVLLSILDDISWVGPKICSRRHPHKRLTKVVRSRIPNSADFVEIWCLVFPQFFCAYFFVYVNLKLKVVVFLECWISGDSGVWFDLCIYLMTFRIFRDTISRVRGTQDACEF